MTQPVTVSVSIREKPHDPVDGGPVFIIEVDVRGIGTRYEERLFYPFKHQPYRNLHSRHEKILEIREWCAQQWGDESEYSINPFDEREIWVRDIHQAMAFKLRWDGKHEGS